MRFEVERDEKRERRGKRRGEGTDALWLWLWLPLLDALSPSGPVGTVKETHD